MGCNMKIQLFVQKYWPFLYHFYPTYVEMIYRHVPFYFILSNVSYKVKQPRPSQVHFAKSFIIKHRKVLWVQYLWGHVTRLEKSSPLWYKSTATIPSSNFDGMIWNILCQRKIKIVCTSNAVECKSNVAELLVCFCTKVVLPLAVPKLRKVIFSFSASDLRKAVLLKESHLPKIQKPMYGTWVLWFINFWFGKSVMVV